MILQVVIPTKKIGITIGGFLTSFDINLGNNEKKYATLVGHAEDGVDAYIRQCVGSAKCFGYPGSTAIGSCRITKCLQRLESADKTRRGYGEKV